MDNREFNRIGMQPDTYPESALRRIRRTLDSIGSPATRLIDKVLETGYLEPPSGSKKHGWYRVNLTEKEQRQVYEGLKRARDELSKLIDHNFPNKQTKELELLDRHIFQWEDTMEEEAIPVYYDLRESDLSQFQAFIFDHEVSIHHDCWYHDYTMRIDYDAVRNAELFIELFKNSGILRDRFSPAQLEQGCWAMLGSGFKGNLHMLIWDSNLATPVKERLIESMFDLYANLFSSKPFGYADGQWWDDLAYNFNPMQIADPQGNEEHRRIQNAMFRTLTRILELDSEDCQSCALHGLNHVLHPETQSVVDAYLRKHPELTEQERALALACARGESQ
jgi:hypothetical protein